MIQDFRFIKKIENLKIEIFPVQDGRGEYNVKKSYLFRDTKITVPEQKFLFNFLLTLDKIAVSYLNNSKMFSFIQFASF